MLLGIEEFNDLSEEEFNRLVEFSNNQENLKERYVVACQIISNLTAELDTNAGDDESVDLTICKLLMDGLIEVEPMSRKLH
jgi:hypothetical protein|tara:strand:+ start:815 stop:1057 length:243 start_codon:yes stop_codon:yes gene_type:complete